MDLWDAGALGVVETQGLAAAIVAVDAMTKAAEVTVIGVRRIGGGLVTVSFIGDIASVTAAAESARQAVTATGGSLTSTVIGRPAVPADLFRDTAPGEQRPPATSAAEAPSPPAEPAAPEPTGPPDRATGTGDPGASGTVPKRRATRPGTRKRPAPPSTGGPGPSPGAPTDQPGGT
ncbi:BMC domain-containing protein [Micromonospora sp. HM134]|uniref:BMC domain-containing protein n=1 Tax=Micromonospora sp. HM134 TaxID=2583243 RepID=UPI0011988CE6|nr:BMC domain-containing protein [Micromonospora sp. HM134]QDY07772.1 BMC domain-containing protein [Micromonospora sp. HM134]